MYKLHHFLRRQKYLGLFQLDPIKDLLDLVLVIDLVFSFTAPSRSLESGAQ